MSLELARANYDALEPAFQASRKALGNAALDVLRAIATRENEAARYLGFIYSMEYFGHGQGGPVAHDADLYDETGKPLPLSTTDMNDVVETTMDDEGFLAIYIGLVAYDLETADYTEYALDLSDGAIYTEPPVRLQERDEDEVE